MVDAFKPDYIAPVVGYLTSEANEETTGGLFEVMGGWAAQTRWQKTGGHGFPVNRPLTPEAVISKWNAITNFCKRNGSFPAQRVSLTRFQADDRVVYPTTTQDALEQV